MDQAAQVNELRNREHIDRLMANFANASMRITQAAFMDVVGDRPETLTGRVVDRFLSGAVDGQTLEFTPTPARFAKALKDAGYKGLREQAWAIQHFGLNIKPGGPPAANVGNNQWREEMRAVGRVHINNVMADWDAEHGFHDLEPGSEDREALSRKRIGEYTRRVDGANGAPGRGVPRFNTGTIEERKAKVAAYNEERQRSRQKLDQLLGDSKEGEHG